MDRTVTVRLLNYRCFPDNSPVAVELGPGFTALVGPNNSGKSSFLKALYETRQWWNQLSQPAFLLAHINSGPTQLPFTDVSDPNDLSCDFTNRPPTFEVEFTPHDSASSLRWLRLSSTDLTFASWSIRVWGGEPRQEIRGYSHENSLQYQRTSGAQQLVPLHPLYAFCRWMAGAMYAGPFRNVTNPGGGSHYDLHVGAAFVAQWTDWKTGNDRAKRNITYRVIDDLERIFSISRLEINASRDGNTLLITIDGKNYRLTEMGSGFAEFVLLLASVAIRQPTVLLIDEPELHLHPSLQLDFLTSLASYTTTQSVVFATHSLGLARAAADRVFAFHRRADYFMARPFENTGNLAEFLGEMSFAGFHELGHDAVLLVEGPSEVRTMQQFLRMMGREHTTVVVQLGGSSMINGNVGHELAEVKRLSDHVFALIDSERSDENAGLASNRSEFLRLCADLGIAAHATDRRATEHYLTDAAIKRIKGEKYRALAPYERRESVSPVWAKQDNWRIAREMTFEDIRGTDIGQFLLTIPERTSTGANQT